jgi:pimeloyl-[acyl-carrier protein] methyl ester esterase
MSLWHKTSGNGERQLLLIHGWGMNAAVWEPLLPRLEKDYRVTLVDLPGHGHSIPDTSADSLASWAAAVAGVAPPGAIWAGWSLGGLVALQAALDKADMSGLFMITATPCFSQRLDWQPAMPQKTLQQFAASLQQDVQATLSRFLSLQVNGCDDARDLLKQLRRGFAAKPVATGVALGSGLTMLGEIDLREQLKQLDIPVRWLLGGRDTLVPGRLGAVLPSLNPAIQLHTIASAGHVPFYSHTSEWLEQLEQLFADSGVVA